MNTIERSTVPHVQKTKKFTEIEKRQLCKKKRSPTNCSYVQIGFNYLSHSTISMWQPTSKLSLLSPFFYGLYKPSPCMVSYAIVDNIKPCLKPRYPVVNRHSDGFFFQDQAFEQRLLRTQEAKVPLHNYHQQPSKYYVIRALWSELGVPASWQSKINDTLN